MTAQISLPEGTVLSFYGDDFTGSSAAMEVVAFAGLPTILFLRTPTPEQLAKHAEYRVIGIAGLARSQNPEWMDRNLPHIFEVLRSTNSPVVHYKVCSTFDSAPHIGSIGRAIDIGSRVLGSTWEPLVVGDPGMARYQAFGHLFAQQNGVAYRIDEHPTMSRHPVTPMDDSNLGRHLAKQTSKRIGLVDFVAMKQGRADARLTSELDAGSEIIFFDVLDHETLVEAGRLIWDRRGERLFGVGSQGFEAALVAYWRASGAIPETTPSFRAPHVSHTACVSGSVSPVTAVQIRYALGNGFAPIPLDATRAVDASAWKSELNSAGQRALKALGEGRDPLVYTAVGPDDPAVAALLTAIETAGVPAGVVYERIGSGLGHILDRLLREAGLTRVIISGGDTAGHAASALGIYALTAAAPVAPGSPLCRAHADEAALDGIEIALKGGQVGGPDFFCAVKRGETA